MHHTRFDCYALRTRTNSDLDREKQYTLTWYDEDYWQWNVQNKVVTNSFLLLLLLNCPRKLNWKLNNKHSLRAFVFKHQEKNLRYQQCPTDKCVNALKELCYLHRIFFMNAKHERKTNRDATDKNSMTFSDQECPKMALRILSKKKKYLHSAFQIHWSVLSTVTKYIFRRKKPICHITITSHLLEPYYMLYVIKCSKSHIIWSINKKFLAILRYVKHFYL